MQHEQPDRPSPARATRRAFMVRTAVAGGAAGAAAVAVAATHDTEAPADTVAVTPEPTRGYRETAHVARYYQLARD